jgi:hypothetical protein
VKDRLKLLAYRMFDPTNASSISKDVIPALGGQQLQPKDNRAKDTAKVHGTLDSKPAVKANTSSDLIAQISKRAYEIHEERGNDSNPAVGDWQQAKHEIQDGKNG